VKKEEVKVESGEVVNIELDMRHIQKVAGKVLKLVEKECYDRPYDGLYAVKAVVYIMRHGLSKVCFLDNEAQLDDALVKSLEEAWSE
jgi:hypothetical protein